VLQPVDRHSGFPQGYDHATLVLDWHSDPDSASSAQHTVNCWENNRLFYRDVMELAKRFPRSCFVIRGKDAVWLELQAFADIRHEMDSLQNVTVSHDYSRPLAGYALAAAADSVIARYTSFGDQCLAAGKPVIYHDGAVNGGPLCGSVQNFAPYPIMVTHFDALFYRYSRVVAYGDAISDTDRSALISAFYTRPSKENGTKKSVLEILENMANAPESPYLDGASTPRVLTRPH
jgi:hypothetical protein